MLFGNKISSLAMNRCEEFKSKIDELVREFKDLSGEEIHEIFKDLADGTLTYVYRLRKYGKTT